MDLRDAIARAGGLYTKSGLAKRWGISATWVGELAKKPGFPKPIRLHDGEREREAWLAHEADAVYDPKDAPT